MKMKKKQSKFHEVFSPTILETQVPNRFVDIINRVGDNVLSNSMSIAKWDWSHKLVGKVSSEVQIPISDKDEKEFLFKIMREKCLEYLNYIHLRYFE